MKTAAIALVGLVLSVTLTGCGGGGGDPETDARAELKDLGFSKKLEDCAIAGIKKEAGSLEEFMELDASEQQTVASKAGAKCAENISKEDLGDLTAGLEDEGVDLKDPSVRKSVITGMTSAGGVSEDVANCIYDKMVDEGLKLADITDPEIIGRIAQTCQ